MKIILIVSITLLCNYALALEGFFIPSTQPSYVVIDEVQKTTTEIKYKENNRNDFTIDAQTNNTSLLNYSNIYFANTSSRPLRYRNFEDATKRNITGSANIYRDIITNYYTISGSTAFSGSLLSGLSVGITSGYEYFTNTGFVDIASPISTAALMTGSSYIGMNAGIGAVSFLSGAGASSVFATALGETVGGIAAGSIFAIASYSVGDTTNVETRRMITKSAVGSGVVSGINLLLGTGFAVSSSSLGTLVLPYIAAVGATYSVNVIYQSLDRAEEIDRLSYVLDKY